jgi:anti-sigma factor RsiW
VNPESRTPACEALMGQLGDYLDGELDPELCRQLESHLGDCRDCQILVDTTRRTISLTRQLAKERLPSAVEDRLWRAIDDACAP